MGKSWAQQEVEYLVNTWNETSLELIMENLDRTKDSVLRKARRLGLDVRKKEEEMLKKKWRKEEDLFIKKNYKALSIEEISQQLNRSITAIRKRALALDIASKSARWSPDEDKYLKEKWGIRDIDIIAKRLKRSKNSVLLRAHKLSLRNQIIANGTYLTPNDVSSILNINIRTLYSWLSGGRMQSKKFKVGEKMKYQIAVEDFCSFLKENQDKWNSQKADMGQIKLYYTSHQIRKDSTIVINEDLPNWLIKKIDCDKNGFKASLKPWTKKEEKNLFHMIEQKYGYEHICTILGRSISSVKAKFYVLNKQNQVLNYNNNLLERASSFS